MKRKVLAAKAMNHIHQQAVLKHPAAERYVFNALNISNLFDNEGQRIVKFSGNKGYLTAL